MDIAETPEFKECNRIWKSLGKPIPCYHPDYMAAREKLAKVWAKGGPKK